jgi:hypothetical protein
MVWRQSISDEGQWTFWLRGRGKKSSIWAEVYMFLSFILGRLYYDVILVTFGRLVFCLLHVHGERSFIDRWFLEYLINTKKKGIQGG